MPKFETKSGKTTNGANFVYNGYLNASQQYDNFGYIVWGDNEHYFGEWKNGQRTGNGCYLFENGATYLGYFQQTNKHGIGIYSYLNNAFYFGNYINNLKQGYGVYIYTNGDFLYGIWEKDKINGKAVRYHAATKTFSFVMYDHGDVKEENKIDTPINILGTWDNTRITLNKPVKSGFSFSSGVNNAGTNWDRNGQSQGNVWENIGLIEWKNDSFYFGEWKNNRRQGVGYLKFKTDDYYIGGFNGVNFHGKGIYRRIASGKTYLSNYVEHKQEGHLFILYDDGSLYYGNAVNDLLEGSVFIIDTNFGVSYNTYKNNKYISEEKAFPFEIKAQADPYLKKYNDNANNDSIELEKASKKQKATPKQKVIDANKELDELIGLSTVKQQLKRIKAYAVKNKDRNLNLHMGFLGNPGTGKTAVARLIGQILYEAGVLENNNFVECSRQSLVAMYIGETAIKTKKAIDEAMGGVLFIDEAYSLNQNSEKDFGKEAIVELLKAMEDNRGKFCCIMAGYTKEMYELFELNPGFKSRVQFIIDFPDYSKNELAQIGRKMINQMEYKMDDETLELVVRLAYRKKAKQNFANAREVRNILEKTAIIQALRTENELDNRTIIYDDVATFAKEHNLVISEDDDDEIPMVKLDYLIDLAKKHRSQNVTLNMLDYKEAVISLSVNIDGKKSESSGFLITPDGYAVTCAHCINGAKNIKVRRRILDHRENQIDLYYDAKVVAMNVPADVAIIKILELTGDNAYIDLLPRGEVDYDALDNIIMLGYPFGVSRFDNISINVGKIVSYQNGNNKPDFINIDLSAKSGNSGSAVLNLEQGYAIGVLCGGSLNKNGELVEEVNYCRPISYVWDLIAKNQSE